MPTSVSLYVNNLKGQVDSVSRTNSATVSMLQYERCLCSRKIAAHDDRRNECKRLSRRPFCSIFSGVVCVLSKAEKTCRLVIERFHKREDRAMLDKVSAYLRQLSHYHWSPLRTGYVHRLGMAIMGLTTPLHEMSRPATEEFTSRSRFHGIHGNY